MGLQCLRFWVRHAKVLSPEKREELGQLPSSGPTNPPNPLPFNWAFQGSLPLSTQEQL